MMWELAIVLVLVLLNGFFALSEMSVVTSRKARLKQLAQDSKRARLALQLAEHPERLLSTVQVGITSIGILLGIFGGESIGNRIAEWVRPLGLDGLLDAWLRGLDIDIDVNQAIGTLAAVTLITFVSIILGELVPKRMALLAPERIASTVALPLSWVSRIATPFVWLLSHSTHAILRLLRLERGKDEQVTEEEIRILVAESHEQGVIDQDERNMLNRVLRLGDRGADSLMTPRNRIVWLDTMVSFDENLATMRETPLSRYPVYRGSDNDVIGVLEVKSLAGRNDVNGNDALFADIKQPLFVSDSTQSLKLLEIFREEQQSMALVVDEYGEIEGLVTATDLLNAVLGRVQAGMEAEDDEPLIVKRHDESWLVDGRVGNEELRELLGVSQLPGEDDHDFHTVAGMVVAHFGRIPHAGESFVWQRWRIEVVDLDGARIDKLLIEPQDEFPTQGEAD